MNIPYVIEAATAVVGLLTLLLGAEALTGAARARRRAKESAEVAAALPEGRARDTALALAAQEVEAWRQRTPTPAEREKAWERISFALVLVAALLVGVFMLTSTWLRQPPQTWHLALVVPALAMVVAGRLGDRHHRRSAKGNPGRRAGGDGGGAGGDA